METTVDKTENESFESSESQEFEAEASKMGWVPKEKFRGDESRWVDAKTFVERGKEVLPIVKAELRKTRDELEEVRQAAREFQAMTQAAKEREVSEWKAKYEQALLDKKEALNTGDGDKFIEAEAKQRELEASRPQPKKDDESKPDPVFAAWRAENEWYGKDVKKTLKANYIGFELAEKGLQGRELYDAVNEALEEEARESSGVTRGSPQRGGKPAASSKGAKTYANLKPEFQEACDKMVKRLGIKAEDYVAKCDQDAFRS